MKKSLVAVITVCAILFSTSIAESVTYPAKTLETSPLECQAETTVSDEDTEDIPVAKKAAVKARRDTIGYDAIGTSRYLITMSRDYYGNPDFWPYIYMENEPKFGHPDKIEPGTTVVIPNLKKYGVNPKNAADIEKAKKLGKEIYARYGKNI